MSEAAWVVCVGVLSACLIFAAFGWWLALEEARGLRSKLARLAPECGCTDGARSCTRHKIALGTCSMYAPDGRRRRDGSVTEGVPLEVLAAPLPRCHCVGKVQHTGDGFCLQCGGDVD